MGNARVPKCVHLEAFNVRIQCAQLRHTGLKRATSRKHTVYGIRIETTMQQNATSLHVTNGAQTVGQMAARCVHVKTCEHNKQERMC
jgi:hypothetical protein